MVRVSTFRRATVLAIAFGVMSVLAGYFGIRIQRHFDPLWQLQNGYMSPYTGQRRGLIPASEVEKVADGRNTEGRLVDRDDLYRSAHQYGWDTAFSEFRSKGTFTLSEKADALQFDASVDGIDGFWDGYALAKTKIQQSTP